MGHPLLEEFCRQSGQLRPEFYRRCQRVFRTEILQALNEGEQAKAELADVRAQLEALKAKSDKRKGETVPA